MPVEEVFTTAGRGVALTARVLRGRVGVGGLVEIVGHGSLQSSARATAALERM